MRLQVLIARAGIASRRGAEELIRHGEVILNGKVVTEMGTRADLSRDHVKVGGQRLSPPSRLEYWLLNKPGNMVTTMSDPEKRPCVGEIISAMGRKIVPAGRLDFHTTGALLLTNDGELAARLTHARWDVEKIYQAKVNREPGRRQIDRLRKGVRLDDGVTAPAFVSVIRVSGEKAWMEIRITEGRNRQVRRMMEAVGLTVEKLRRTAIGPIKLGRLPTGNARHLTSEELADLRQAVDL